MDLKNNTLIPVNILKNVYWFLKTIFCGSQIKKANSLFDFVGKYGSLIFSSLITAGQT